MYERFTDATRRSVVLGEEEARLLGHDHIGTEHLLLGVIREGEAGGARILARLGVSLDSAREQIETAVGRGGGRDGHRSFTPRAKKVLERALRASLLLRQNDIATEHVLLGIMQVDGVGAQVLEAFGVTLNAVYRKLVDVVAGYDLQRVQMAIATDDQDLSSPQTVKPRRSGHSWANLRTHCLTRLTPG